MKLIGKLKDKVGQAETKEDARELIKNAGMLLDDEELDQVSGGWFDLGTHMALGFAKEADDLVVPPDITGCIKMD